MCGQVRECLCGNLLEAGRTQVLHRLRDAPAHLHDLTGGVCKQAAARLAALDPRKGEPAAPPARLAHGVGYHHEVAHASGEVQQTRVYAPGKFLDVCVRGLRAEHLVGHKVAQIVEKHSRACIYQGFC